MLKRLFLRDSAGVARLIYVSFLGSSSQYVGGVTGSSPVSHTETVPVGASHVVIEAWGGGGGGGVNVSSRGGGGAAGNYCRSVYAVAGGETFTVTIGPGGTGYITTGSAPAATGTSGNAATVASGSVASFTTMIAGGGIGGGTTAGGVNFGSPIPQSGNYIGGASGGNQVNTTGASGLVPTGAAAVAGIHGPVESQTLDFFNDTLPTGTGGEGGTGGGDANGSHSGLPGLVVFTYT